MNTIFYMSRFPRIEEIRLVVTRAREYLLNTYNVKVLLNICYDYQQILGTVKSLEQ